MNSISDVQYMQGNNTKTSQIEIMVKIASFHNGKTSVTFNTQLFN